MLEVFLAFVLVLLIICGMAIGVIMGKKPLKGSCGGVGAALGEKDYVCEICGDDPEKCVETESADEVKAKTELGYDATR
ncbi:(Na+)-NQR maturation NqrM [Porticoccus litoralis]|uniref:(Na+)-NQR maturation NqrM n=1 Tax=Porticoccus litoralis TaxID=434086 RepID=A0AAW8B455_9GAMM|nr:(Na+)-NQR maturation NqrM [Porticoccus litoralis]MDP1521192.1 (Na+)-NQR maturation NqrM [Porticoccus litoralis]